MIGKISSGQARYYPHLPVSTKVLILAYHRTAEAKHKSLGLNYGAVDIERPARDHLESIARQLEKYDLQVKIGG